MVLYVVMEKADDDYLRRAAESLVLHKLRFEELSGWPCLMMRYPWVTPEVLEHYPFRALVISGFGHGFATEASCFFVWRPRQWPG